MNNLRAERRWYNAFSIVAECFQSLPIDKYRVRRMNKQELIEIKEQYKLKCIMLKRTRYNSQLSQKDLDLLKIYTYINNRLILAEWADVKTQSRTYKLTVQFDLTGN